MTDLRVEEEVLALHETVWNACREGTGEKMPLYTPPRELSIHGVPIAIVDPHNEAFYFWAKYCRGLDKPAFLVHIDSHSDAGSSRRHAGKPLSEMNDKEAWQYTQELTIESFIEPAVRERLINPVVLWQDVVADMVNIYQPREGRLAFSHSFPLAHGAPPTELVGYLTPPPLIWDIDLDAFALCFPSTPERETAPADIEKRIGEARCFLSACARPNVVTIARSQTPETYCPPTQVDYVEERTLRMLDEVLG